MVPYIWHKSMLIFKIQKTTIDVDLVSIYICVSLLPVLNSSFLQELCESLTETKDILLSLIINLSLLSKSLLFVGLVIHC